MLGLRSIIGHRVDGRKPLRPLEGSVVLEVAEGAAAPLCGRLLSELGARVIKVEPPDGDISRRYGPFPASGPDPELSGLFIYQNAGKESVVLDWRSGAAADALLDLASYADILIDDIRPKDAERAGIDFEALRERNPRLIRVSLTPFGQTGPCAGWEAEHLTLSHMGGEGYVLPGANSDPENKLAGRPPIQIGGLIADAHSGYIAAIAAMGAVAVRDHSGVGQHVDISKWEAELIPNRGVLDEWNNQGEETGRQSATQATMLLLPCKDGLLYITFHRDEQFERLANLLGKEEWKTDPRLATPVLRGENREVYIPTVVEWLADKRGEEIFHILESRGMMATFFAKASEILASEHWQELGVFAEVESSGGVRFTVPRPMYFVEGGDEGEAPRAPALGEHTAAVLGEVEQAKAARAATTREGRTPGPSAPPPLAGVRILDLSWIAAGPAATNLLGCLGAEMIRLESAKRIDLVRFKGSIVIPGGDPERAPLFNALNFNKQGVVLDLKRPESLDIVYDLVKSCDAVIDNMRPGVMETLALGPEVLRQHNPTLVTVSASGFGPRGPQRDYPAIAPILGGSAGVSEITGYADGGPYIGNYPIDLRTGSTIAFAIIAALAERSRTGKGRHVDLSSVASIMTLFGHTFAEPALAGTDPGRTANRHPWMSPHGVFPSLGEEQWVTIAARTEEEWRALCVAMGRPSLADDPRFATMADRHANNEALEAIIGEWTAGLTNWEVTERLQQAGVAAMPSMSNRMIAEHPHLQERGAFWECPHPVIGPVTLPRPPWHFESFDNFFRRPTPLLGQHTHEVMTELLGYSEAETARLDDLGIFV